MKSPIKYFGGKGGMYQDIIRYFPPEDSYEVYIEPFGGAASILLQKKPTPIEIYNDLNKNVYSLFKVLSDKKLFAEFKKKCDISPYSKTIRDEFKEDLKGDLSVGDRAYKYFYVNRTSVNGVGGFAFTTTVRRNMCKSVSDYLSAIDGLTELHQRLSRVIVENRDALKLIPKYDRDNVFMYLDSPYHQSTRTTFRYEIDMTDEQQAEYIDVLLSVKKAKMLVSGYDCPLYNELCKKGWKREDFKVNTTDGTHKPKKKVESLWMNYDCNSLMMENSSLFEG